MALEDAQRTVFTLLVWSSLESGCSNNMRLLSNGSQVAWTKVAVSERVMGGAAGLQMVCDVFSSSGQGKKEVMTKRRSKAGAQINFASIVTHLSVRCAEKSSFSHSAFSVQCPNAQRMAFSLLLQSSLETAVNTATSQGAGFNGAHREPLSSWETGCWLAGKVQQEAGPVVTIHLLWTAGPSAPVPSRAHLFQV